MQSGQMNTQQGQMGMQPGSIPGMQPGIINPTPGTKPTYSKNMNIQFLIKDVIIGVKGNSAMTIEKLVKNFKIKLCDEEIIVNKYIMLPSKIELNPNSTETLASKGITGDVKIMVNTK